MAHKHTCYQCTNIIAEGDFDCDYDTDHDFGYCSDQCKRDVELNEVESYISERITRADATEK